MSWERFGGLREAIAQLAAQIMYGEGVKEFEAGGRAERGRRPNNSVRPSEARERPTYLTAKRLAAKRLIGRTAARGLRHRPRDLPSNGEIKQALLELVEDIEGDSRTRRLFAMRIVAIEAMHELTTFSPRLIGSVATGHVRSGSDVDLHVFAEHADDVAVHARRLGWTFDVRHVSIMKHGKVREYTHVEVCDLFPVELTVYPPQDIRTRPRSSTDGKPIIRLCEGAVRGLCERDHPEQWSRYLATGAIPPLEELLEPDDDDDDLAED